MHLHTHEHSRTQKRQKEKTEHRDHCTREKLQENHNEDIDGEERPSGFSCFGGCHVCWIFSNALSVSTQKAGAVNGKPY